MLHIQLHESQDNSRYQNPDLESGLKDLEDFRPRRAEIARIAAKHIIEACGGETLDTRLYYAAMFGKAYGEGIGDHDPNLLESLDVVRMLNDEQQEGQPLLVRAADYPAHQVEVGVVGSFSEERFEPVRFEVETDQEIGDFNSWTGGLAIAMRKVVPKQNGEESTYELSDEVSKLVVGQTATWNGPGGLEIHAKGIKEVKTGEMVHANSRFSERYEDEPVLWLRQHLAPTERKPLADDIISFQKHFRTNRKVWAEQQGVSEAQVAAQGLSPTLEAFFDYLRPYSEGEEPQAINTKELFQAWHDPYDAQALLAEMEFHDLVEADEEGGAIVSSLGREALRLINRER